MPSSIKKKFYVCGVSWQHHVGETPEMFYSTIKELKANVPCWKECGIVEIEMKEVKWISSQKFPKSSSKP